MPTPCSGNVDTEEAVVCHLLLFRIKETVITLLLVLLLFPLRAAV